MTHVFDNDEKAIDKLAETMKNYLDENVRLAVSTNAEGYLDFPNKKDGMIHITFKFSPKVFRDIDPDYFENKEDNKEFMIAFIGLDRVKKVEELDQEKKEKEIHECCMTYCYADEPKSNLDIVSIDGKDVHE